MRSSTIAGQNLVNVVSAKTLATLAKNVNQGKIRIVMPKKMSQVLISVLAASKMAFSPLK